ncbi:hypothetical protein JTB14_022003 [Gonioctena quinquepunctata]|nr:hypothetical protein JTB14_022003 [Gonioctena quinquepunctata]
MISDIGPSEQEQKQSGKPQENIFSQEEIDDMITRMEYTTNGKDFKQLLGDRYNKPLYQYLKETMWAEEPEIGEKLNEAEFEYQHGLYSSSESSHREDDEVHDPENAEPEKAEENTIPRKEGNAEKHEEIDTITGEGSKKGGEAGLVPRTYSMGAQPPSSNQPLDGKTNKNITLTTDGKNKDEYLSSDSILTEDYFRKRTKQDQDIKNQSKNPRKEVNSEKFEDEYFMHLSNSENEEEIEQLSEEFRKTEKTLGQIAQQKGSSEPMQIENVEIPQNITMESKISIESPLPVRLLAKPIIKHTDRDISDAQRNLYPEVRIIQLDGPSDADNAFSPSSEEEGLADLSMKKKNIQHKRNIKRRKTSRTKEEFEIEQEDREVS